MSTTPAVSGMRRAIQQCLDCHQMCFESATNFCLEAGGAHVEAEHYRLMLNCAQVCRTCADLMMSSSAYHASACELCMEICIACADSCEKVGQMEECVEMCRRCAASCREMAGSQEPEAAYPPKGASRREMRAS
jgi:hypothetical protein